MFLVSSKKKAYYYKANRVKKGTSSKGDPFTFVGISTKEKGEETRYANATLVIWQDVDIKEGDKIAFYDVTGVNFKTTETATKTFYDLSISATKVKVKEASEKPAEKVAPKEEKSAQPERYEEPLYGGDGDDTLPF